MNVFIKPIKWLLYYIEKISDVVLIPVIRWFEEHPESRWWLSLFRLGLIQFGIGLSLAPISGALNRVLITDLKIPAVAVGFLIALHYFISPVRALIGYRSDRARSQGTWRTPYVVLGVMLTFAGLTCAPFALILLSGDGVLNFWGAFVICIGIFLAYGAGINIVETIYLALVSDITPKEKRGKAIATLWVMLIMGTVVSAIIVSALLVDYSHQKLIQVMQGSALTFVVLTVIALWGQERLRPDGSIISENEVVRVRLSLWESLKRLRGERKLQNLFGVIFVATMAFATHDVLLEPYGGEVLGMSVSQTMQLTALWGVTTIVGVICAGILLTRKMPPSLLITVGCGVGLMGFITISYSSQGGLVDIFRAGVAFISVGRGLFIVGSIILVMSLTDISHAGLFLGVWGIVQAIAQGVGVIGGSLLRDVVQRQLSSVPLGYTAVYTAALLLLSGVLLLMLRLGQHLKVSDIRMPWDGVEEIPADQLVF